MEQTVYADLLFLVNFNIKNEFEQKSSAPNQYTTRRNIICFLVFRDDTKNRPGL